jgi:DNA repair exonuclease SbcCD ATPase subunit
MFAAIGLTEFGRFLQIASWIILPVLILSVLITVWYHRKRKNRIQEDDARAIDFLLAPAGIPVEDPGPGAYVLFDHSNLIRQYQEKLSYNHARYAALQQDFKKLELKYSGRETVAQVFVSNDKNNDMENTLETVSDQICMTDLLNEKTAQVDFLQSQLDQRIRNYHQLRNEFETVQTENTRMKEANEQLSAELAEKQHLLIIKLDHITWLENALQESKQQNLLMDAAVGDQQDLIASLEEKLSQEETTKKLLEQKLERNERMLQKIHRVIGSCIHFTDEPKVIELQTAYK